VTQGTGTHGSKFTPETLALFIEGVRDRGLTLKAACGYAGIATRTLERWHARARSEAADEDAKEIGPYTQFFLDIELAQGRGQATVEEQQWKLINAGDGPSIRRWLEAHDPPTWGRRTSGRAPVVITGDGTKVAILQQGTSENPADYFGVESVVTDPTLAIEGPAE